MIGLDQWRAAIGLYAGRHRDRSEGYSPHPIIVPVMGNKISLMFRLFLLSLLLCCGDIESNPGPSNKPTQPSTRSRQGTLGADGSILGHASRPPTTIHDPAQASPTRHHTPVAQKDNDILVAIRELTAKFTTFEEKLSKFEDTLTKIESTQGNILRRLTENDARLTELGAKTEENRKSLDIMERKIDALENQSRRSNLIFHGVGTGPNTDSWDTVRDKIVSLVKDNLAIELAPDDIERAHRLGRGHADKPAPVIVKFLKFTVRESILKNKAKLKNSAPNVRITEDFTKSIREIRKKLFQFTQEKRTEGKSAKVIFDHAVVDGVTYVLDSSTGSVKAVRPDQRQTWAQRVSSNGSG